MQLLTLGTSTRPNAPATAGDSPVVIEVSDDESDASFPVAAAAAAAVIRGAGDSPVVIEVSDDERDASFPVAAAAAAAVPVGVGGGGPRVAAGRDDGPSEPGILPSTILVFAVQHGCDEGTASFWLDAAGGESELAAYLLRNEQQQQQQQQQHGTGSATIDVSGAGTMTMAGSGIRMPWPKQVTWTEEQHDHG